MSKDEIAQKGILVMHRAGIIDDIFGLFDAGGSVKHYLDHRLYDAIEAFDDVAYYMIEIHGSNINAYHALHAAKDEAPFLGRSIIDMVKSNPYSIYKIKLYYNAFIAPYLKVMDEPCPEYSWEDSSGINIVIRTSREGGGKQSFEDFFHNNCKRIIAKKLACLETVLNIPLLPADVKCDDYSEDSIWVLNAVFPVDHNKGTMRKIAEACDLIITRVYYLKDMGIDFYLGKVILDIDYNMTDGEITLITKAHNE
jgi:hypothetical protein